LSRVQPTAWIRQALYDFLTSRPMVWLSNVPIRHWHRNVLRRGGCTIDTNDPVVTPWVRSLIFWGFYERPERRFVKQYLPATQDVVELGGSIGVVSAQIGKRLEAGRRLVVVEANPRSMRLLEANAKTNAPDLRVSVVHAALARTQEPVEIAFGESTLAAWINDSSSAHPNVSRVPGTTLSHLLSEQQIGAYALVSDVEGAEAGLFLFDSAALARCTLMIIELHATTVEGRKLAVDDLQRIATEQLGFSLIDRNRDVFVFQKKPSS
jgi:FkbM family methyltransferase